MIWFRRDRNAVRPHRRAAMTERLEPRRLLSGNLVETFVTPFPASVLPGAAGSVVLGVSDAGPGQANGRIQISLLLTTDGTAATTVATVRTITPIIHLPQGKFQNFTLAFKYPANLAAGSYQFLAVVDSAGTISQTPRSEATTVIAPRFVNLTASFAQAPTFLTIAQTPTPEISIVVRNSGNTAASGKVSIDLYESPTQTLGAGAVLLQTFPNQQIGIAANGSETLSLVQKKIPLSASVGDEFMIAVLNTAAIRPRPGAATVTAVAPFSTSFATALFASVPVTIPLGQAVSASVLVSNAQTTAVHGDEDINLYASPTPTLGAGSTLLAAFSNRPINIPVNGDQTFTLNFTVPRGSATGIEFLIATLTPVAPLAASRTTDVTVVSQSPSAIGVVL